MRRTPSLRSNLSGISRQRAQNKGALADKLDRSTSSTHPSSTPSEFSSTTSVNEVILVSPPWKNTTSKKKEANKLRKGHSKRDASARHLHSVEAGSWLPTYEVWNPEVEEGFANQVEAKKQKAQKFTGVASPVANLRTPEELKEATKSSAKLSKKHEKSNRAGDFVSKKGTVDSKLRSEKPSKHTRKTERHSQSERGIKRDSSPSNNSKDHALTPQEAFRAFLLQDRITQSRRDIVQNHKRQTKRSKSAPRPQIKDHSLSSSVHRNQKTPITPIGVASNRSRLLTPDQAITPTIGIPRDQSPKKITRSPCLHSLFEWTRSPTSSASEWKEESPVSRPEALHFTPSSRGKIERRKLTRKAYTTSSIHQYHVTPEWPSQRRNARLHSLFYDLSVRREGSNKKASSTGVPVVSAKDMLSIMEPCSRREILTAQGLELEPPLCREDCTFNYGDVIDNISLESSKQ